jgi:hypothetical protein
MTPHPVIATSEPHDHTSSVGGPVDFAIQCQAFPAPIYLWKKPLRIAIRQPNPQSNRTLLLISYGGPESPGSKWYNVRTWNLHGSTLDFCLKARVTRVLKHPFPIGLWGGQMMISPTRSGKWRCLFSFQKQTLVVKPPEPAPEPEPERRRIILPHEVKGLPRVVAPSRAKIILP